MKNIAIVGLGFVGLTLAVVSAKKGYKVHGIEINNKVIESLNAGKADFHEEGINESIRSVLGSQLTVSKDLNSLDPKTIDCVIITVGTPLNEEKEINTNYILSALDSIKPIYNGDQLIILRSTVSVGLTREIVVPYLAKMVSIQKSQVKIAFCPERTIEGNAINELEMLPQIIGALNNESYNLAEEFFRKITPTILQVDSLEAAELVKLFNNAYRDVEFSVGNYFNHIAQSFGIDGVKLIKVANYLYPRSRIALPGLVGGPCLEKDSYILVDKMPSDKGKNFILGARKHNESIDKDIAEWIINISREKSYKNIGISGLAFKGKPDTSDLRGSPSLNIVKLLEDSGINDISVHDFLVPNSELSVYGRVFNDFKSFANGLELLVILTNNNRYKLLNIKDLEDIMSTNSAIFDAWGVLEKNYDSKIKIATCGNMFLNN